MIRPSRNLLNEHIRDADAPSLSLAARNHGVNVDNAQVECVFRDVEHRICQEIAKHTAVRGCVAWLTSELILRVLARMKSTHILVQKEDFLRPDVGGPDKEALRRLYADLSDAQQEDVGNFGYNYCCGHRSDESVRCVGYVSRGDRTIPRMHNKFLVLGRNHTHDGECEQVWFEPQTVITGSYNMTANAGRSLENIVIIRSPEIAAAYSEEFRTIFGISEPLDWTHEYVDPHYADGIDVRLGS